MVLLLEITKLKITQKPTRNVHYAKKCFDSVSFVIFMKGTRR